MKLSRNKVDNRWYRYIIPKQLTKTLPLYRWLFWNISLDKAEYREVLHKKGQNTFVYCPHCDNELISSNSFVEDTDYVYYKCSACNTESKWDFDFICPILCEYKEPNDREWKPYNGNRIEVQ